MNNADRIAQIANHYYRKHGVELHPADVAELLASDAAFDIEKWLAERGDAEVE